jgi:hypothetical protein
VIEPTDEMVADAGHNWEDVYWGAGRWRGHKAAQRLCSWCEIWETPRSRKSPCRGKKWDDLTDQEKAAAFGGERP